MEEFLSLIHWSFFAVAILVTVIVKFLDRVHKKFTTPAWIDVFFPEKGEVWRPRMLSAIAAAAIGIIPGIPAPEMIGDSISFSHVLYFSMAGILGTWIFSLAEKLFVDILPTELKQFIEKRLGTEGGDEEGIDDDTSG